MLARVLHRTAFFRETHQENRDAVVLDPTCRNCHSGRPLSPHSDAQTQAQKPITIAASNQVTNRDNPNHPFLILPNELLLMILDELDQPSLESLRRSSPDFLRVLPTLYPHLFSRSLQGKHPWPVRRLWTLSSSQRHETLVLVANKSLTPTQPTMQPHHPKESPDGRQVACCRMLGLANAWRFIPCPDCGLKHPPRALPAPLPAS